MASPSASFDTKVVVHVHSVSLSQLSLQIVFVFFECLNSRCNMHDLEVRILDLEVRILDFGTLINFSPRF